MPGQGLHLPRHFERTHPKTCGQKKGFVSMPRTSAQRRHRKTRSERAPLRRKRRGDSKLAPPTIGAAATHDTSLQAREVYEALKSFE
jgi:hypothetical protein